jgi:hypothetical protein
MDQLIGAQVINAQLFDRPSTTPVISTVNYTGNSNYRIDSADRNPISLT